MPASLDFWRSLSWPHPVRAMIRIDSTRAVAQGAGDLVAVHSGQANVEQDQVGLEGLSNLQGCWTVVRDLDRLVMQLFQEPHQAVGGVEVIVHDEDALALRGIVGTAVVPGLGLDSRGQRLGQHGEPDEEFAAGARPLALGLDGPSVLLDQGLDQTQADPQAAVRVARMLAGLHEHAEDLLEHRRLDADAGVRDPHEHLGRVRVALDGEGDPPPVGCT